MEFILDQAGFVAEPSLPDRTLLEPACGDGAFLVAAARRLAESADQTAGRLSSKARAGRLAAVLEHSLWGVDLDEVACSSARDAVRRFFRDCTGRDAPAGFFTKNVNSLDFLLDEQVGQIRPVAEGCLDFVIGNPPYVPTTELSASHKERLRGRFRTAVGRIDLYVLFIERALEVLAARGVLSFIVPDKLLQSYTAGPLRALLFQRGAMRAVAQFESHRMFADVATVPCVFVFELARPRGTFRALECIYHNGTASPQVVVERSVRLPGSRLGAGPWRIKAHDLEALASRLCEGHPTLGDHSVRISAGLATGRDNIFVVPEDKARDLEPDLLRQAVRGRDIGSLSLGSSGLSVIVPYTFRNGGRPELIDIGAFPRTFEYLRQSLAELETRHCVRVWRKAWFDIHDPVPADIARQPKLLVPDLAEAPRFAFDPGHVCPLHSAYYVVLKEATGPGFAALLNSLPIEFLVRMRAPVVKDGFNRYRRQFLIDLPIPRLDDLSSRRLAVASRTRDFDTIDEIAAQAFRLSTRDVDTINELLARFPYRRAAKDRSRASTA